MNREEIKKRLDDTEFCIRRMRALLDENNETVEGYTNVIDLNMNAIRNLLVGNTK